MDRNTLLKNIVAHLQLSTMEPREKAMWMLLLPEMEERVLVRLDVELTKEVSVITDLYLEAIAPH